MQAFPGMTGWMGNDVWYAGVSETINSPGPGGPSAALFGSPASITGNALDFDPQGFVADAPGPGFNSDITDSQLSFMVVALPGKVIDNIFFTERGDTTLIGNPTSFLTATSVTNSVFGEITHVNGSQLLTPVNVGGSMTFTPSGGDYSLSQDSNGFPIFSAVWNGDLLLDLDQFLAEAGISGSATKVNLTFDNTLSAVSADGESAFIAKKDFDGVTIVTNVPEPSAAVLLGIATVGFMRRRRS